jgi:hypothetical protein
VRLKRSTLPVGLGSVGARAEVFHVELGEGVAPQVRAIAAAVVGQDSLDRDAVGGEPGLGPAPESRGCLAGLVVVDLEVGKPGVVVDLGVDVGVAAQRAA